MPSTSSSVVSVVLPSSTVITPSLPTFSMASARRSPISGSLFAVIVADVRDFLLARDLLGHLVELLGRGRDSLLDAAANRRRIAAGHDVASAFAQDRAASTVAVVVPSPASVEVLSATSCTSFAPMFSNGSSSSISLLTVTPSLVTVGPPNFLSRMTLRPFGPRVTLTASASWLTRGGWPAATVRRSTIVLAISARFYLLENSIIASHARPRS